MRTRGARVRFPASKAGAVQTIYRLRARCRANDAVKHCLDLITNSCGHYGTKHYDTFQYYNDILPKLCRMRCNAILLSCCVRRTVFLI